MQVIDSCGEIAVIPAIESFELVKTRLNPGKAEAGL